MRAAYLVMPSMAAFLFMADNETKAGNRHSKEDRQVINAAKKKARELAADMDTLGADPDENPLGVLAPNVVKAEGVTVTEPEPITASVKAVGDMRLEIRVAYGGPFKGRDAHGEYFTERTDFDTENFPTPPVSYYHGFDERGNPKGKPIFIGKTVKRENRIDGHYITAELKRGNTYAERTYNAALKGEAPASPGTAGHLRRVSSDGHCDYWPIVEIAAWDGANGKAPANPYSQALPALKALYADADLQLPNKLDDSAQPQATGGNAAEQSAKSPNSTKGVLDMDEKELIALLDKRDAERKAAEAAEAERKAKEDERINAAVKAEREKWETESAKGRRLESGAPYQGKFPEARKYDNLSADDLSLIIDVLTPNKHNSDKKDYAASNPDMVKALALRLEGDEGKKHEHAAKALKSTGIKANELNHTTQAGYGDEWIGVAYSSRLWEAIRQNTFVGARLMGGAIEIPQGFESIYLPLEGADPTFYKVAETTDNNATTGIPNATVTASKVASDRKLLTAAKMGARTIWSGEMDEDSLIAFASQLRAQLERAGSETLEHVLIDGDTATSATTNINDIGGTPAGTEAFLLLNGFRKSPLVTTTANSRSASGSFVAADFIETLKLMGLAGRNADKRFTEFIVDKWTAWKALELPEVKSRDVFAQPTLENGELTQIYGYKVNTSAFMHWANQDATYGLKANTSGKVDLDTASNNTRGAILAVRFDQWQFGFKRRMTIETQRIPQADATQIVALMRFGMVQRDTEAAAITYNVGV